MRRGTRVGGAYVDVAVDGDGINDDIVDAFDEAGNRIGDKGEEHGEDYGDGFSDGFLSRIRGKLTNRLERHLSSDKIAGRAGDKAGETFVDRMSDKVREVGDKITDELSDRIASRPEQVRRGIERAFDDEFADRVGDRMGSRVVAALAEAIERQSGTVDDALDRAVSGNGGRARRREDGLAGMVARVFGAGARNNFLNLLGRSIGGVIGLVERGSKVVSGFADGFKSAADNASLLSKVMSGLRGAGAASGIAGVLRGIAASGPVAVVALGAVLVTFSAFASVAGALVGILTALASTITSALVGALAVVGPLIGAVTVAGGLMALAFTSMTNAQKDYLFNAFQPFKAALTGVGQLIFNEFTKPIYDNQSAIQVWSDNLQRALLPLAAIAPVVGRALADAGNVITGALSGPGFQQFFATLGVYLPGIIRNLSSALGSFLNGVGGMFAAIMPYVAQFSQYLADVALRFSNFATSRQGQNSIVDFVGRALGSLKSLWGAITQIGGLIADIFFSPTSQRAGNNIFDRIAATFANFRKAWAANVANGSVERWFKDATKFGSALWDVIKALWDVFMSLYNSGVLTGVAAGLRGMAKFMSGLAKIVAPLIDAVGWFAGALGTVPEALAVVMDMVGTAVDVFLTFMDVLTGLYNLISPLMTGISGFGAALGALPGIIADLIPGLDQMAGALESIASRILTIIGSVPGAVDAINGVAGATTQPSSSSDGPRTYGPWAPGTPGNPVPYIDIPDLPNLEDLISSGNWALNNTFESMGGYLPDPVSGNGPKPPKFNGEAIIEDWVNPYKEWASKLLDEGRDTAVEIKAMAREAREAIAAALDEAGRNLTTLMSDFAASFSDSIMSASQSIDTSAVSDSFGTLIDQLINSDALAQATASAESTINDAKSTRDQMVSTAQAAYNSAVQAVASATNEKEAEAAIKALKKAERNLGLAMERGRNIVEEAERGAADMIANAKASQEQLDYAAYVLNVQRSVNLGNVSALLSGTAATNITLSDYAEARRIVAERLEAANQQLVDAIAIRNNYAEQVASSLRSFASITSAQAKVLNGVTQSLTADDITDNLRDRLNRIKKFQENLRLLTAQGLSDDAYKQLVDAGVDEGGKFAEAILAGGQGAVSEVNDLTKQIGDASTILGNTAANQLYQAGVDAAKGLVDGLESLSAQLSLAAYNLGNEIALAIKRSLGIASPSKVLYGLMYEDVGDGAVNGLNDAARLKVSPAAAALAAQVAVSPEVAAYASRQGANPSTEEGVEGVSGNDRPTLLWTGDMITPSEDPKAVAIETANELTGRL